LCYSKNNQASTQFYQKTNIKLTVKKVDPKYAVEQKRDGKVFVGGLRSETTDEAVKSYFETFGPVENIERPYDKHQGKAKGFAFITFTEDNIISKVVVEKYHDIEGKRCEVKEAVPSELNTGYETNNFRNEYSRDNGYPRNDYNRNELQRNDYGRNEYNNRENYNKSDFNRPDYNRPENSSRPNFNRNDNYTRPDYNRDNRTDNYNRPESNNYNRSNVNTRSSFNRNDRNDYSRQHSGPRGPPQFNNRQRHPGPQIRPTRNLNAYQPRGGGQSPNRGLVPRNQPRLASPRFPVRNIQPGQCQVPNQVHMHRTYNPLNPMLVNPGSQISHNTQINGLPANTMQPQNSQIANIHMPITAQNVGLPHVHQNMTNLNPRNMAQNIGVPVQIPGGLIQNTGMHNTGMHMNPSLHPINAMNPAKIGMHPHFSTQIHPAQIGNGQIHNGQLINGGLSAIQMQAYAAGQIPPNVQFLPDASSTTVLSNPDDSVEKISARVQSVDLNESKNSNLQEEHLAGSLGNLNAGNLNAINLNASNLNASLNNSNINTSNLNSSNLNSSNLNSSNLNSSSLNSSAINSNTLNSTINSAANATINLAVNSGTINSAIINPNTNANMPGSIPTTINSTSNSVLNSGAVNSNSTTPAAAPIHVPISPLRSNLEIYNHYTQNQQQQQQQTQLTTVPSIANPNFISQLAQQQAFQQILNSQVLQQQQHHQQQPQQQLNISNRLIEEQLAQAHLLQRTQLSTPQALGQSIRPNMPLTNLVQNPYSANVHPTPNPIIPGMQALLPGQPGGGIMQHPHHHPHLHAHQNLAHQHLSHHSLPQQQNIQSHHQHLQQHQNLSPHQNLLHHPGVAAQQVQSAHSGHQRQHINQHVQQHPTPNHPNSPQAGGQIYGQPRFVNRGVRPYGDRNFNNSGRGRGGHSRPQGRGPYNSYNRQDSGSKPNEVRR